MSNCRCPIPSISSHWIPTIRNDLRSARNRLLSHPHVVFGDGVPRFAESIDDGAIHIEIDLPIVLGQCVSANGKHGTANCEIENLHNGLRAFDRVWNSLECLFEFSHRAVDIDAEGELRGTVYSS